MLPDFHFCRGPPKDSAVILRFSEVVKKKNNFIAGYTEYFSTNKILWGVKKTKILSILIGC
jgi:hypothetical protein